MSIVIGPRKSGLSREVVSLQKSKSIAQGLCIWGTRPSGLYREVVPGYKWSLRQVPLYHQYCRSQCLIVPTSATRFIAVVSLHTKCENFSLFVMLLNASSLFTDSAACGSSGTWGLQYQPHCDCSMVIFVVLAGCFCKLLWAPILVRNSSAISSQQLCVCAGCKNSSPLLVLQNTGCSRNGKLSHITGMVW